MIRSIIHDEMFLSVPSEKAGKEHLQTVQDLRDTLHSVRERCAGMAANMIGVNKNIIAVTMPFGEMVMINPVIIRKAEPYETEEGCLSLKGQRKTTRYRKITVRWQNENMEVMKADFSGFTAQVIQHEIDHCAGIVI
ncbi:MAG: peptide deformylase [Solobacterium sp.]|nr:peptide deformylase [Solobacterium sp.]